MIDRSGFRIGGGANTIARALKTIEERHPDKVKQVARKIRLFLIWEQDNTYQQYIRPHWEKYNILSIISDQFDAIAYDWHRIIPEPEKQYYKASWMKKNILTHHGPLCSMYRANDNGDFRSEGDSPSFMHAINTGLRSMENPGWGGWGGRYVNVRNNTWLDPIVGNRFAYPQGRWSSGSGQGRTLRTLKDAAGHEQVSLYYRPLWRWSMDFQNDWAARADWSITPKYEDANHPPEVKLAGKKNVNARPGETVKFSAVGSNDPDGDELAYAWWQYKEAGSCKSTVDIHNADKPQASFVIPNHTDEGETIHVICEVTDNGNPPLTRYQRVIVEVTRTAK